MPSDSQTSVFQPIRAQKLADSIVDELRKLIREGVLRPGDRLPVERRLAEDLDVSRPTLREALARLESDGLLVSRRGALHVAEALGPAIADPLAALLRANPSTAFDYLEFRSFVEGEAARLVAEHGTTPDLARIEERYRVLQTRQAGDDRLAEAEADAAFHLAVYEASGNTVMLHVMRALAQALRQDVLTNRKSLDGMPGYREAMVSQHLAIFEAIMRRDGPGAAQAGRAHVEFARRSLQEARAAEARLAAAMRRLARRG